jgi:cytoskeletal protein CcmA (bactofilin family)
MSERDWSGVGELQALLGPGAEFEGTLVFAGRIRIEGRFSGEIRSEDVLILGASADVRADIEVGALIVRGGSLRGRVRARQLVEIYAPGQVHGDIEAPQVFLEKGAVFEGRCTMLDEKPALPERVEATAVPAVST